MITFSIVRDWSVIDRQVKRCPATECGTVQSESESVPDISWFFFLLLNSNVYVGLLGGVCA